MKKLLLRNYMADFVEICNVCARKAIIEAATRIINSDKVCHSYSDLNFGVTFFGTHVYIYSGVQELFLQMTIKTYKIYLSCNVSSTEFPYF